jgi:hypothetical protein
MVFAGNQQDGGRIGHTVSFAGFFIDLWGLSTTKRVHLYSTMNVERKRTA